MKWARTRNRDQNGRPGWWKGSFQTGNSISSSGRSRAPKRSSRLRGRWRRWQRNSSMAESPHYNELLRTLNEKAISLGRGLWSPCALRQVVLIESLPDQRLDDGLTAHVEVLSSLIQFLQHAGSNVHIDALNRLNHAALAFEETGNILALIG